MAYDNIQLYDNTRFSKILMVVSMAIGLLLMLCLIFCNLSDGISCWCGLVGGLLLFIPMILGCMVISKEYGIE